MPSHGELEQLFRLATLSCFGYLLLVYAIDIVLMVVAGVENAVRGRERRSEDFGTVESSRFTIPVSILVPVCNEEALVVPVLESLLAMRYPEREVVVVNDGSTDRTLELLRERFDLEPQEVFYRAVIPTAPVLAIYRSRNAPGLTVMDKESGGGKAAALNCALNLARYRYVLCVDGNTVYTEDALLKGMRLVLRNPAEVIGVTSQNSSPSVGACGSGSSASAITCSSSP